LVKVVVNLDKMFAKPFYVPSKPSAFPTLAKPQAAVSEAKGKKPSPRATQEWLHQQDAYTLHKPLRKRLPRNPYLVNNDAWEADLLDVQNLSKHNDNCKYLLTVFDVLSKFLHVVPLKNTPGPSLASGFQSILQDKKYNTPYRRRPLVLQTDRGKDFLNKTL
jgi:hypothetical protein